MGDYDEAREPPVTRLPWTWIIVAIVAVVAVVVVVGVVWIGNSGASGSSDAEAVTRQLLTNYLTRVGYLDTEVSDVRCVRVSDKENDYKCVVATLFYGVPKTATGILKCEDTKPTQDRCSWRGQLPSSS